MKFLWIEKIITGDSSFISALQSASIQCCCLFIVSFFPRHSPIFKQPIPLKKKKKGKNGLLSNVSNAIISSICENRNSEILIAFSVGLHFWLQCIDPQLWQKNRSIKCSTCIKYLVRFSWDVSVCILPCWTCHLPFLRKGYTCIISIMSLIYVQ